jgi:hypothetical protein
MPLVAPKNCRALQEVVLFLIICIAQKIYDQKVIKIPELLD